MGSGTDIYDSNWGLPEIVPVFPLSGALLMPRTQLPLNIFEPRYLDMVRDARQSGGWIGMIQPKDEAEKPDIYDIGCLGRIGEFSETEDGRYLITLVGVTRFRVSQELVADTAYRQIVPDFKPFTMDQNVSPDLPYEQRAALLEDLKQYLDHIGFRIDWSEVEAANDEAIVNALAILAPFDPAEKQALLEAKTLNERTKIAQTLLQFAVLDQGEFHAH